MAHSTYLTVWRDVPTIVKSRRGHLYYGDVPCGYFNEVTGKFEVCDNHRGNGYAARRRLKYRKNKKYLI